MAAHQSLPPAVMLEQLRRDGYVECNSPKNRQRLYRLLESEGLAYTVTVIGYTTGRKSLNRRSGGRHVGWTHGRLVHWIRARRLTSADLPAEHATAAMCRFFDEPETASVARLRALMRSEWNLPADAVYQPFDMMSLRTTVCAIRHDHRALSATAATSPSCC